MTHPTLCPCRLRSCCCPPSNASGSRTGASRGPAACPAGCPTHRSCSWVRPRGQGQVGPACQERHFRICSCFARLQPSAPAAVNCLAPSNWQRARAGAGQLGQRAAGRLPAHRAPLRAQLTQPPLPPPAGSDQGGSNTVASPSAFLRASSSFQQSCDLRGVGAPAPLGALPTQLSGLSAADLSMLLGSLDPRSSSLDPRGLDGRAMLPPGGLQFQVRPGCLPSTSCLGCRGVCHWGNGVQVC